VEPKETIHFKSLPEIIAFAITKEEEANQFYLEWAKKVKSQAVRDTLLEFAAEEENHKKLLQEVQQGKSFSKEAKRVHDLKLADYFTATIPEKDMSYQDALRIAIQKEIGARELYHYLAEKVSDTDAKNLFINLEKEEALHKNRLEIIYDRDFMTEN
jgi:rubrerythrin